MVDLLRPSPVPGRVVSSSPPSVRPVVVPEVRPARPRPVPHSNGSGGLREDTGVVRPAVPPLREYQSVSTRR